MEEMLGEDIFGQMFGGGMGGGMGGLGGFMGGFGGMGGRRRTPKGESTVHRLKVTLEELYSGKVTKLQLSKNKICSDCEGAGGFGPLDMCGHCRGRGIQITVNQIGPGMVQQMQSKCSSCNGEGEIRTSGDKCKGCSGRKVVNETKILEVQVEPGMRNEERIIFRGEGDQAPGVEPGDVFILLQEVPHPDFKRDGNDLIMVKKVTLTEALCGFQSVIKHLDGRHLLLSHPGGEVIKPDTVKGLPGEGMAIRQRPGERGDLYVQFKVDFPENYFANETKLMELEKILGGRPIEAIIPDGAEDVDLAEFEEKMRSHSDDDDQHGHGMHGGQQVQCAQH